jgi:hypothetical protein
MKGFIMWFFTDLADWFDERKSQANRMLDSAVESSGGNQGVILAAVAGHTIMELGGSVVDLARLGDGIKAGGLKGWGQDALRVVAIFPVGKTAQVIKTAKGTTAAKVVADIMPRAGICAWVASAKGLRQIEHSFNGKILATVDDLVKAVGVHPYSVGGLSMSQITFMLNQIGAKVGVARKVKSMREVERMVPFDGSVVLFGVKGTRIKTGKKIEHLVYAYRDLGGLGPVKIMDRTVNKAAHRPYRNLAELAERYTVHSYTPSSAVVLHNVFVRTLYDLPRLVVPVPAVIGTYEER